MGIKISVSEHNGDVSAALRRLLSRDKCEISGSFLENGDVLVAHKGSPHKGSSKRGRHVRAAVINSDEKDTLGCALNAETVVTYGFNARACVTASSVSNDSMQVCIQRSLPCLSGGTLEQQEFSVPIPKNQTPEAVLAATATALICGHSVE